MYIYICRQTAGRACLHIYMFAPSIKVDSWRIPATIYEGSSARCASADAHFYFTHYVYQSLRDMLDVHHKKYWLGEKTLNQQTVSTHVNY